MQVELKDISLVAPSLPSAALWLLIFRIAFKAAHRQDKPIGLSLHNSCLTGAAPSCSDDLVQRNGIIVLTSLLLSCATRQASLIATIASRRKVAQTIE